MKSWKIGAIAGLIAGIILGITFDFFARIVVSMGFWEPFWQTLAINNICMNILLFGFWGIVLGVIYSRIYYVISSRRILKGLIYGLGLYILVPIRIAIFTLAYGRILFFIGEVLGWIIPWILYGLLLGILFDEFSYDGYYPIDKKTIKEYNMIEGIKPGAIAGLCGGIAASIFAVIGHMTGYWGIPAGAEGQIVSTIEFWWSQAGSHIFMNMFWGAVFGAIFLKVYNLVPGKGVKKGLYYGLIVYLITSFLIGTYNVGWAIFHNDWIMAQYLAGALWIIGGANGIIFALAFGLLYRKSPK